MKCLCLFGYVFLFLGAVVWANEDVAPVGTPVATAVASPDVTEGRRLGRIVALFDLNTWWIVGKYWNQPERTLVLVDDHMAEGRVKVLEQLAELGANDCVVDTEGNWVIGTGNAERDAAFAKAYAERVDTLAKARTSLLQEASMKKVALAVQQKEREFRQGICTEIMAADTESKGSSAPADSSVTEDP